MSASLATRLRQFSRNSFAAFGQSSWVFFSFLFISAVAYGVIDYVPSIAAFFGTTLGQLSGGALVYSLVVLMVIAPMWIKRGAAVTRQTLGLDARPTIAILWLPIVVWAAYMVASIIEVAVADWLLPWVDQAQAQDVGFIGLTHPYEYVLAFIALVILPPLAEELLFRGYLFGRLRKNLGFWATTLVVSALFGLVHFQWNVGLNVAVLSIFLCWMREYTGSVWSGMALHALKNGIAYFLLFIAPLIGVS